MSPRPPAPPWLALLVIAALAFAVRIALAVAHGIDTPLFSDESLYGRAAASLAAGQGFRIDGIPTAKCMPGWPFLMSVAFALFGPHAWVARGFACLLGAISPVLLALAANRLAGPRAAVFAALGAAFYPPMVVYSTSAFTESPAIFWLAFAIWLLFEGRARGGIGWFLATGVAFGMGVLTRGASLAFAGAACLALLAVPRAQWPFAIARVILIVTGAALVVAPWVARNGAVLGRPTITTQSQSQLWQGAHPGATGLNRVDWPATKNRFVQLARYGEAAMSDSMGREAREFIREHPLDYARIGFVKAWELWKPWSANVDLVRNLGYALTATPLLILGLGSAFARRRTRFDRVLLLASLALFTLLHMLYTAIVRYRVMADVPLILYAAAWVAELVLDREASAAPRDGERRAA